MLASLFSQVGAAAIAAAVFFFLILVATLPKPGKFFRKAARDLLSTLYNDNEFREMSAPRVWGWIAILVVVVAWFADQFLGYKFSAWTQLISWAVSCLGAYGAKKIGEGIKSGPPGPPA